MKPLENIWLKNTLTNMAKLVDANLIIRFLIKDNPTQSEAAQKIFISLKESLILHDIVLTETVWTLLSVYKLTKQEIVEKLLKILELKNIVANHSLLINSLLLFRDYNISFIDAYLLAYSGDQKLEGIYSFDKGLDKIKKVKRFEPK